MPPMSCRHTRVTLRTLLILQAWKKPAPYGIHMQIDYQQPACWNTTLLQVENRRDHEFPSSLLVWSKRTCLPHVDFWRGYHTGKVSTRLTMSKGFRFGWEFIVGNPNTLRLFWCSLFIGLSICAFPLFAIASWEKSSLWGQMAQIDTVHGLSQQANPRPLLSILHRTPHHETMHVS